MKTSKTIYYTLAGAMLLLATLSACKSRVDAPNAKNKVSVEATLDKGGIRALFVGGDDENDPSKIKWGEVGDQIPIGVMTKTYAEYYKPSNTTFPGEFEDPLNMVLRDSYGTLFDFPYRESDLESDGSLHFFTCAPYDLKGKLEKAEIKKDVKGGTFLFENGGLLEPIKNPLAPSEVGSKVKFTIEYPSTAEGHGDYSAGGFDFYANLKQHEVEWPLIGYDKQKENGINELYVKHKPGPGQVAKLNFKLFGNMLLLKFVNNTDDPNYNAFSMGDENKYHRPKVRIESNGMLFANGATCFEMTQTPKGVEVATSTVKSLEAQADLKYNYITFAELENIDFKTGDTILPVWFRPVKPANGEPFFLRITFFQKSTNPDADHKAPFVKSVYTIKPNAKLYDGNGTIFNKDDGAYYGISVGIQPALNTGISVNSFVELEEIDVPPFY